MTKLIDTISLPEGLHTLGIDELSQVCSELRDELIDVVSESGGHFASSLGATELTVALHHLLNSPTDRLVWDVGHQAYIHKMVTGRRHLLPTIRKKGGISGFLKRSESTHDSFGAGHAGTSISAAVGMSLAAQKREDDRYVVAIIGDGSLTSGMAFEALNHAGSLGLKNFIVVLNDNEMSISPNVGAISWLFSRAVTSTASNAARSQFKNLYRKGYVPELVYRAIDRAEEAAKGYFSGAASLFEAFGFRYIGPVDGHNVADLVTALEHAKTQDVPVLVHAYTVKGKGYDAAECDPLTWHGVNPFDRSRAEFRKPGVKVKKPPTYTTVFAETLVQCARQDPRIMGITAAMPTGTGLDLLERELPQQFLDVGICEQHAVTLAAGLACDGMRPVAAIYSTFLQRGFDQVVHDVCIQNLPVVFAIDRAGTVGNDGETHQGVFDIAYLRSIPNLVLMAPKDEDELRHMMHTALHHDGPSAIRYPRGEGKGVQLSSELMNIPIGSSEILQRGEDVLFLCAGPTSYTALEVADRLRGSHGVEATVLNARFIKPLDRDSILAEASSHKIIVTIEDHALMAGFGSAVLELLSDEAALDGKTVVRFGVNDQFIAHASQAEQYEMNGYDPESVYKRVAAILPVRPSIAALG